MAPSDGNVALYFVCFFCLVVLFLFSLDSCVFSCLCSMLHLQMGDESEPVTTQREGTAFLKHCFNQCCFTVVLLHQSDIFIHFSSSFTIVSTVSMLSPSLFLSLDSAMCFHVSISHPFPSGRTLLSHLSSLISPLRPQITAPLRLVQGTTLDL